MRAAVPKKKNKLPQDESELEDVTRPYRLFLRPWLHMMSKLCVSLGAEAFDKDEIRNGELAIGALMYQEGFEIGAWGLVAGWAGSVVIPRANTIVEKRDAAAKARREKEMGYMTRVPPVPPVQPVGAAP